MGGDAQWLQLVASPLPSHAKPHLSGCAAGLGWSPEGSRGSSGGVWESSSTACMEKALEMQSNCLEQEAPVPGTTQGVPWQQGRETSLGNGVTRLAPALLSGTKWRFPAQPAAHASSHLPLCQDASPILPAIALGLVCFWQESWHQIPCKIHPHCPHRAVAFPYAFLVPVVAPRHSLAHR